MNDIEKLLSDEHNRMDSITAPDELESRLRNALDKNAYKKTKRFPKGWKVAAVVLIMTSIVSYNYNAFAYYGKKIFGFDALIDGTLLELNEAGMGQSVDARKILLDGTELVIDGIMSDANQFIMYYTLSNPSGLENSIDVFSRPHINGFLTNSNFNSGTSIINDDQTEVKGMMTFDPVSPFAKKLTLSYWQNASNAQMVEDSIIFDYYPDKAMQTEIKKKINESFKVDQGSITFKSITATPTMTLIKGTMNVDNFDRVSSALDGIELIANEKAISMIGSGRTTSYKGTTFEIKYDVLPKELNSLQLVINEFVGYEKLEAKFSLDSNRNEPFKIGEKKLWLNNISTSSNGVEVTIATDEDVMLDGVSIVTINGVVPLNTTVKQDTIKQADGTIMKERTLLFDTLNEPQYILIEGMHYMKTYNYEIEIPVK
ncbi:DUF4179 domain-containing protein [Paenibacillus endoradicis]|uniref:DUF4179 domain-containing protein n=1 Tax=Paenibacillus endoradicis TaxID=2972487 RepID=UPI0021595944|nr:DUF4179 domain-containing protein [Paenibacillus endoradicis]MCR8656768.1 DUF4179 domain-containing protein [Paenibacillus endoradicis]